MATLTKFEDLEIWKLAREQSLSIHKISANLISDMPLLHQIKASSGSVMDNIAEGFERNSVKEFIQFLFIAKASNAEVRSQLYRAYDIGLISESVLTELLLQSNVIGRKIHHFIQYLRTCGYANKPFN